MYGRGSYDMKGSLAACMLALDDIRANGLAGDVILAAVADEEHASIGVQSVLKRIKADAAIVTEPSALDLCIAHKGFSWHEITTTGRAAHGSRPDLGIDGIAHMGRVLSRVEALQAELSGRTPHPLLGHGQRGNRDVVESGHRAILWNANTRLGEGAHGAHGGQVVEGQHGGEPFFGVQQFFGEPKTVIKTGGWIEYFRKLQH